MASLDNIYEFTDKEEETEVQNETGMNDGKLLYILTHSPTYPPMSVCLSVMSVCLSVFLQLKISLSFIKQYIWGSIEMLQKSYNPISIATKQT